MLLKSAFLLGLCFLSHLTSGFCEPSIPSINDIMSIEDQKTTGIIRLTQEQKTALAKWLITHNCYTPDDSESIIHALKVSLNFHNGKTLQLSDDSIWEIAPEDREIASSWLTSIPIKVSSSTSKTYPYLLTNLNNQVGIKAKQGTL